MVDKKEFEKELEKRTKESQKFHNHIHGLVW